MTTNYIRLHRSINMPGLRTFILLVGLSMVRGAPHVVHEFDHKELLRSTHPEHLQATHTVMKEVMDQRHEFNRYITKTARNVQTFDPKEYDLITKRIKRRIASVKLDFEKKIKD